MFGLTRIRIVEIGVALLLTLAAILFVGLTVWAAEMARIEVAGAWARPTAGPSRMSAAYMTIANKGATDDRLKSARTPKAKSVELHQTTMTADGVMQMRQLTDGLEIPAGGEVKLEPGSYHLMFKELKAPAVEGVKFPATLTFEKAGTVKVEFSVEKAGEKAGGEMDHSAHGG